MQNKQGVLIIINAPCLFFTIEKKRRNTFYSKRNKKYEHNKVNAEFTFQGLQKPLFHSIISV